MPLEAARKPTMRLVSPAMEEEGQANVDAAAPLKARDPTRGAVNAPGRVAAVAVAADDAAVAAAQRSDSRVGAVAGPSESFRESKPPGQLNENVVSVADMEIAPAIPAAIPLLQMRPRPLMRAPESPKMLET